MSCHKISAPARALSCLGLFARLLLFFPASVLASEPFALLKPETFERHIERFNKMEDEPVVNLVPNETAWSWLRTNVPLFECSDAEVEEIYWFRWWALRKHLRRDEASGRFAFTEFIT